MPIEHYLMELNPIIGGMIKRTVDYITANHPTAEYSDYYSAKSAIPTFRKGSQYVAFACRKHYISIYLSSADAISLVSSLAPYGKPQKRCVSFSYKKELPFDAICKGIDICFEEKYEPPFTLRFFKKADGLKLLKLFRDTVHTVNAKDYNKDQLNAWIGGVKQDVWTDSLLENTTIIAEANKIPIGFADMDEAGYLERIYIAKTHINMGVGRALISELERLAAMQGTTTFTTHASITARPFFESMGYKVVRENIVQRGDVALTNYLMEKSV